MTAARVGSSLRSRPPGRLSSASRLTIHALAAGLRSKVCASRRTMTPSFLMTIWAVKAFEPSLRERPIIVPILPPRSRSCQSVPSKTRYDMTLTSTTLSYHRRENGSKTAENGTTSALMEIYEVTDKPEKSRQSRSRRFSVAPMMEWTDRHCRFFHRLLTHRALLYTEMLTTGAVLHGDRARLLRFDPAEHPVALQLGGSGPRALAECARIGADADFDEI